jgi:hypothetical protein
MRYESSFGEGGNGEIDRRGALVSSEPCSTHADLVHRHARGGGQGHAHAAHTQPTMHPIDSQSDCRHFALFRLYLMIAGVVRFVSGPRYETLPRLRLGRKAF